MKKVTKILASAAAVVGLFFSTNVNAQAPKLGIGINVGVPTDKDYFNFTLGGDARFQFDVANQLSIPVTVGYTNFFAKDRDFGSGVIIKGQDYGFIPVKAGLKYFFDATGSGLYGLAEAGAAFGVTNNAKTAFLYSPAIGYAWSNGLDLGVKYEGISNATTYTPGTTGQVALRIAYGFKL
jgi:hypothetical protein